jgi:hypothetical protein
MKSLYFTKNHSGGCWLWVVGLLMLILVNTGTVQIVQASTPIGKDKNRDVARDVRTKQPKASLANGVTSGKEEDKSIVLPTATGALLTNSETSLSGSQGNNLVHYFNNQIAATTPTFVVAPIKIKVCYNSDQFGISGTYLTFADDKLINLANWGPSGTDTRYQFELFSFGTGAITSAALVANGCQIFVAGGTNTDAGNFGPTSASALSTADKDAIKNWATDKKNVLIAFQGMTIYAGGSGYAGTSGNANPNSLTSLGEKIISGVFGTTTGFNQGGAYQGKFTAYPSTACVITQDRNMNPTGLLNSETGDFYLADYDMISENAGLSNNNGISTNTDKFFANLMSSAATIVVNGPENACDLFLCPAGTNAPNLTATTLSSSGTPVDLTTLFTGTPPLGTTVTYHNATPVADNNYIGNPTSYTESGTVYAAFRAADGSCYSPSTPAAITINCPDLEVSISPVSGSSAKGETQTYTVTVKNNGPITAPEAKLKVPIPTERTLEVAIPSAGTYSQSTQIWNVGQLTNGQSATLQITIRVQ